MDILLILAPWLLGLATGWMLHEIRIALTGTQLTIEFHIRGKSWEYRHDFS